MKAGFSIAHSLQERNGNSKISILKHPIFWAGLGFKAMALFFLGSSILTEHYIPFVHYFIDSGFANPYEHFLGQGISFPFPALMLMIVAAPTMLFGFVSSLDPIVLRMPILFADLTIFLVLIRWLKDKQEKVLWYYWCSPILFAIGYVAGFLDIVPMALLFVFLYFLFKEKYFIAFILLGLALATKTGLVILLPFILIYLLKEYEHPMRALGYVLVSCTVYILINLDYLFGPGFWQIVFFGGGSFASNLHLDFGGVVVYLIPLLYLGLVVSSYTFQRLNKDMFLMFLAFALGTVTLVMVPQAGWYSWIIPFFVYFFVKEDRAGTYPFVLLNIFYFGYFLLVPHSIFLEHLPGTLSFTVGAVPINMAFTLLQGALLLNIIWICRLGIQNGVRHKIFYKPYLVGIAGDSASGKSTVTGLISKIFGTHNTLEVAGDDMHRWERGDPNWSRMTHLNPIANKLHDDMEHAIRLRRNESVIRRLYDHAVGRFTSPERIRPKKLIVFQGLHSLYLNRARELLDLKIFLSPHEELRRKWKLERDVHERGHDPASVLQQLDDRDADAERYIREQHRHADIIISMNQDGVRETLVLACDNSIDVDPLISLLEKKTSLEILREHAHDMQHLVFAGAISNTLVEEVAYEAVPEIWEINRREQQWEGGFSGLIQVFLAYVVFHKAKLDHDSF